MKVIILAAVLACTQAFPGGHGHGHDHDDKPPCGLPPWTDKVDEAKQAQLRAIWDDYVAGTDCTTQTASTKTIYDSLPSDVKSIIMMRGPHSALSKKLHGRHHHGPSFLENATAEVRGKFDAIHRDKTLSKEAKMAAYDKLAATLSADLQTKYRAYKQEKAQKKAAWEAKVAALSPSARTAYNAKKAICDDETLTKDQKKVKKEELYASLTQEVRQELMDLKSDRHRHHGHGHDHGAAGGVAHDATDSTSDKSSSDETE